MCAIAMFSVARTSSGALVTVSRASILKRVPGSTSLARGPRQSSIVADTSQRGSAAVSACSVTSAPTAARSSARPVNACASRQGIIGQRQKSQDLVTVLVPRRHFERDDARRGTARLRTVLALADHAGDRVQRIADVHRPAQHQSAIEEIGLDALRGPGRLAYCQVDREQWVDNGFGAARDASACVRVERQAEAITRQRLEQRGVARRERDGWRIELLPDDEVLEPGAADIDAVRIRHEGILDTCGVDQASIIAKSLFAAPQEGQYQSSGMSSHLVPGAMPSAGSPAASS